MATRRIIKCRSCGRAMLMESTSGLVPVEVASATVCDTCEPLEGLHSAVRRADEKWQQYAPKKQTNLGRIEACINHKKAHMNLDNWLMNVEAATTPSIHNEVVVPDLMDQSSLHILEEIPNGQQQTTQRARSHSPVRHQQWEAKHPGDSRGTASGESDESDGPARRPTKRSSSTASLPERKQLKFADSVEFRDSYRDSSMFHRGGDSYEKGSHAPENASDFLDTSGYAQTFLRFTREKKVKDKWVEVDEKEANRGNKYTGELRKLGVPTSSSTLKASDGESTEQASVSFALHNGRAQRAGARKSKRLSGNPGQKQQSVGMSHDVNLTINELAHPEVGVEQGSVSDRFTSSAKRKRGIENTTEVADQNSKKGRSSISTVGEADNSYDRHVTDQTHVEIGTSDATDKTASFTTVSGTSVTKDMSELSYPDRTVADTALGIVAEPEPIAKSIGSTHPTLGKGSASLEHGGIKRQVKKPSGVDGRSESNVYDGFNDPCILKNLPTSDESEHKIKSTDCPQLHSGYCAQDLTGNSSGISTTTAVPASANAQASQTDHERLSTPS